MADRYEQYAYRIYMTDAVMYLGKNMVVDVRWYDLMTGQDKHEDIDVDEVVDDITTRAGLEVIQ